MSLKRVVIPLRDVKFMLDDEVSSLFSKIPPNLGDSKIKELKNHENISFEEDNVKIEQDNEEPQTNKGARKSKRSAEKPKYDTEEPQEKRGGRISKRSSEKSKHVNTNEDISSDDDITVIASVEFPKKRGGRKSVQSVENPKYRYREETPAKRYGRRSKRSSGKTNYKETKEDSTTDEDIKVIEESKKDNSTDKDSKLVSEESQTKRYGRRSQLIARKPKHEESTEDNTPDEDSKVTKDSKEENTTDEDSKKKVEFEDSESDGCTKNSKKIKFDEGNESDENKKKSKKIKFDESSESDESEFGGKRKNNKKIKVDDDSESDANTKKIEKGKIDAGSDSDGGTKNSDNSEELKSAMDETSSNRKKYSRIKLDEGSESDVEAKNSDNENVQANRTGRKSKRSVGNPQCKESNEDSASDEDIKDNKKSKQTSARPRRGDFMDEYESEEGTTSSDDSSKRNVTEEELSFDEETTTTEESSSQYSSDGSSSSSEKSDTLQKKHKESSAQKRKKGPLSEYEKRIEEKRSEKMKFLKSIKIDEVKEDLKEVVKKVKKKKKKSERHTSDDELSEPVRRSSRNVIISEPRSKRRVREKEFNYSEDALYEKVVEEALSQKVGIRELMPVEMSYEEALLLDDFYRYYVVDIKVQESKSESNFIYDKSVLEKLGLNPPRDGSFKLETDSPAHVAISAFAWYPSPANLILAAGCSTGTLSFWNVNTGTDPYIFKNHLQGITHLQFNPFNHNQVISSSLDGTMRCGDMVKKVFNELYASTEYTCCQYFDFLSDSSYIVSQNKGLVAIVDHRTDGKRSEKEYLCHDLKNCVKTVNVHPVNKSYFVTANTNGCVRLWDLRKMQEHPIAHIQRQDQGTQFAFFSPVTGNSILASTKFCFSIYDSTNLTENIRLRKEKRQTQYRNLKGSVKATWMPNSEEAFYISSNADPQGIVVYDTKFNVFHKIAHKAFTTATTPISLFHPVRPAVAFNKTYWGLVFSTDVNSST